MGIRTPEGPQPQEPAHIPESEFTWGIPTRSDVKDPEYHEILRLEELNERIYEWRWPTSTIFLHNHVVAALRFTGEDPLKAEQIYKSEEYRQGLIVRLRRKAGFKKLLDPQLILDHSLRTLSEYEQALIEAKSHIPNIEEEFSTKDAPRYKELPEGVKEERLEDGWRYTFKPWDLISRELTSLREDLERVLDIEEDPIKQIQTLWEALDSYDRSPAKKLAGGALRIPLEKTSYRMEHDQKTEAGRLHSLNEQIAAESDIYVGFDESYLVHKRGEKVITSSPFEDIVNPERRFTSGGLWVRSGVRDYLREQFTKERRVVFNGVEVKAKIRQVEDKYELVLKTFQELPQWFVNLTARPVEVNGKHFMPEEWAIKERGMVNEYRGLALKKALQKKPIHPVVEELLSVYEGFRRELTTPEEQLDHLLYSLRKEDWERRHRKI